MQSLQHVFFAPGGRRQRVSNAVIQNTACAMPPSYLVPLNYVDGLYGWPCPEGGSVAITQQLTGGRPVESLLFFLPDQDWRESQVRLIPQPPPPRAELIQLYRHALVYCGQQEALRMYGAAQTYGREHVRVELNSLALCIFQSYPYFFEFDAQDRPSALQAHVPNALLLRGVGVFTVSPFARMSSESLPVSSLGFVSPAGHVFLDAISIYRDAEPCDRPAGIYSVAGLGI